VANRLEPWTVSAVFLAGPAADQGVEMATGQSESEEEPAAIPVHELERSVLLPQGLSWPYLPLFGVLDRGGEAPGGMDLWPGPPEESPLDNPRLTLILAGVLALLLVVAAVQYVLLPYLERNRAEQLVTRLKDERGRLRAQKQELLRTQDALQAVDQVAESREQALSGLLEVAELLPEDTWLQEFEYSQGGIVLTVQGGAKQELEKSLAGSRLLSLTGEPSRASAPQGQVAWKISLTFQEDGAAPPPAEATAPRPAPRRPAPPPVRRPSQPPTPRPLPPGGGLPRPN
jgi:Tfp pilus assembly protein PilN